MVGVIGAALVPYEVYFYSSGAIEDRWKISDLNLNRANAILGFTLGGILSIALIVVAGEVFFAPQVHPGYLGTTALGAEQAYGEAGLLLALLGMLFAVGGAAVECAFSGAYTLAQLTMVPPLGGVAFVGQRRRCGRGLCLGDWTSEEGLSGQTSRSKVSGHLLPDPDTPRSLRLPCRRDG